ncbi:LytTR family DNA-binding domain-containing protein [Phenylobacterium sp.]|uniref:LytTR family DNA-binding domain-containing protein n=1 Tax=Phenylobacterium sp. TaxID=1871053 RepID=UPI0035B33399
MNALVSRLTPFDRGRDWLRSFSIALAAGLFLTLSGAFGSGHASFLVRLTYWMSLMVLGAAWGGIVARFFFSEASRAKRGLWPNAGLAAVVIAAPFTLVVFAASRLLLRSAMGLADLPLLFVPVLVVSLIMTALNVLIEGPRARAAAAAAAAAPAPPKFLERLPLKLRGAEVWAVEAEDHYLRLHTSKGQDLILLRLADAVAELEGIEGMQVHRSWWVARDAIVEARRGDGRATLKLKDGAEVPVSRTYAGELRAKGWI